MANITKFTASNGTTYDLKDRAGDLRYGTCATAAATAAKVVTLTGFTLVDGATIHVKFTNSNTVANPTLNVNSTGAKSIMRYGTTAASTSTATSWLAGAIVSFTYDGTYWVLNDYQEDTNTDVNVTQTVVSANSEYKVLLTTAGRTATGTSTTCFDSNISINASTDILKGLKDVGIDGLTTTDGGLGQAINALGWWSDVQL